MPEAGIVVVTYNSGAEIGPCLDAALATGCSIVVVDNASSDNTLEEVRRRPIGLLANPENRGFAAAVNQGVRALSTPLILLLNPDAVLLRGLDHLVAACALPHAAGASGMLVSADGVPQTGFMFRRLPTVGALVCEILLINRLWPANPVNWHYRCFDLDHSAAQTVEQPAGAFLMIRRDVWAALGGFDEDFHPLWFEDVDYCKRAQDRGYGFYYEPAAVAKHTGGHSIPKIPLEKRQFYWYRSLLGYIARHSRVGESRAVALAVMVGSLLRMVGGVILERSLDPIRVYAKVIRLAGRHFWRAGSGSGQAALPKGQVAGKR
jgi:N-acetylglucosaminyl-diphospho-decaprenol L-rhamnosyltransferase